MRTRTRFTLGALLCLPLLAGAPAATSQEKSVNPGINKSYENPDPGEFARRFEVESREIFARRNEILAACKLKPGMSVADVGAGTGLFTRLFADAVGPEGKVYAVDIAPNFVEYITRLAKQANLNNVVGVVCTADSTKLPENSADLVFVCDTYHHFEFPFKTMASVHKALRPGGRVVVIDFKRVPGESSDWVLSHVRAGQEVFRREIESAGFVFVEEPNFLKENYCMVFRKAEGKAGAPAAK